MKLLFITNIPSPYRVEFFNLLANQNDLTVIFSSVRKTIQKFNYVPEEKYKFRAIFLNKSNKNKIFKLFYFLNLFRNNYDYIFHTNYNFRYEFIGYLYTRLFFKHKRIVEIDGAFDTNNGIIKKYIKRYILGHAVLYFSPSEETDLFFMSHGVNKDRIKRYPFTSVSKKDIEANPPNISEKKILREELGLLNAFTFIAVGQFIHRKGFDVLIKAMANFKDSNCVIIGGEVTPEYEDIIAENQIENVLFLPFMNQSKLNKFLKTSDVFIHPTREDIWGLVINEAMAKGLPVITTRQCMAGVELIEEDINGYLYESEDIGALVKIMNKIKNDPTIIEKMKVNNLQKISDYTIEDMVAKHIEHLSQID